MPLGKWLSQDPKKRSYLSWLPIQNQVTVSSSAVPTARQLIVTLADQILSSALMHLNCSDG